MNQAADIALSHDSPRTHRIGWSEITDLARVWHALERCDRDWIALTPKGEIGIRHAKRLLEDVLDSIDLRWRQQ